MRKLTYPPFGVLRTDIWNYKVALLLKRISEYATEMNQSYVLQHLIIRCFFTRSYMIDTFSGKYWFLKRLKLCHRLLLVLIYGIWCSLYYTVYTKAGATIQLKNCIWNWKSNNLLVCGWRKTFLCNLREVGKNG